MEIRLDAETRKQADSYLVTFKVRFSISYADLGLAI